MALTDVVGRLPLIGSSARHDDAFVERWSSLARFPILFWMWGWAASDYKLFIDLSVRGVIVTVAFFLMTIFVTFGFRTRSSMAVLAAVLAFHGILFHHTGSLVAAPMAAVAALFPIGAWYSVDRYLAVTAKPVWYAPRLSPEERPTPPALIAIVAALALVTLGGPFYKQVLNHDTRWVRSWIMFSNHGRDLVVVNFFTVGPDGRRRPIDYIRELGVRDSNGRRRNVAALMGNPAALADVRILGEAHLDSVIRRVCARTRDPDGLRLQARIALVQKGWRTLYTGDEPICSVPLVPVTGTMPTQEAD